MTIDINELRRLAQAAMHPITKGHWVRLFGERTVYDRMEDGCRVIPVVSTPFSPPHPFEAACLDFIAAANPATISDLLDRLEAAEKGRDWHAERCEDAMNECEALRAKIEGVEDERMIDERRIADLMADLNRVGHENDALRAKIEHMENQGPVAWLHETRRDSDVVTDAVKHVWGKVAVGSMAAYSIPLYTLPGAKGEEK